MLRRLLLLADVILIAIAVVFGVQVYRAWTLPFPEAGPRTRAAAAPEPTTAQPSPASTSRPAFATYAVVAERNLFSPNRTEAPPEPPKGATTVAQPPGPKPRLHGVVFLADGQARAYLEDIQRRRVFAYAVGDTVADSRVEQIRDDRVVLSRGGEVYEVLLRDPSKPKPVVPPGGAPGIQPPRPGPAVPQPGEPTTPGVPPRVRPRTPGPTAPGAAPGVVSPPQASPPPAPPARPVPGPVAPSDPSRPATPEPGGDEDD